MPMTTTDFKNRINNDLALLGLFIPAQQETLIVDAVIDFCKLVDPAISASLSVVEGTKTYSVPDSISKVEAVFDSDRNPKVYSIDQYAVKITFQDDIATGTYTVFGQPKNIKSNIDVVLAGISEDYEPAIWQYVRAHAHKAADSDKYITEYKLAREIAISIIEDNNRGHGQSGQTIQFRDTNGNLIADSGNVEGITPNIYDLGESVAY